MVAFLKSELDPCALRISNKTGLEFSVKKLICCENDYHKSAVIFSSLLVIDVPQGNKIGTMPCIF